MEAKKYHIGKNGPAPCGANPDRPGGRACRFGEESHGTESELTARWEAHLREAHGDFLSGSSRSPVSSVDRARMLEILSDRSYYGSEDPDGAFYSREEVARAIGLATEAVSDLAATPVGYQDTKWRARSSTSVRRYELVDGTIGYFKSFRENSRTSEYEFQCFGTSTLGAAVNEVNAYRMAQLLGPGYDELVPETVLRAFDGDIGSFQREVREDRKLSSNFHGSAELREDFRHAAIFDFVIGNLDRHDANYLLGVVANPDGTRSNRLRLIDNAYSFPDLSRSSLVNDSVFADNYGTEGDFEPGIDGEEFEGYTMADHELELTDRELNDLRSAREGVDEWIRDGSIGESQGRSTLGRIDRLLSSGRLSSLADCLDELHFAAQG